MSGDPVGSPFFGAVSSVSSLRWDRNRVGVERVPLLCNLGRGPRWTDEHRACGAVNDLGLVLCRGHVEERKEPVRPARDYRAKGRTAWLSCLLDIHPVFLEGLLRVEAAYFHLPVAPFDVHLDHRTVVCGGGENLRPSSCSTPPHLGLLSNPRLALPWYRVFFRADSRSENRWFVERVPVSGNGQRRPHDLWSYPAEQPGGTVAGQRGGWSQPRLRRDPVPTHRRRVSHRRVGGWDGRQNIRGTYLAERHKQRDLPRLLPKMAACHRGVEDGTHLPGRISSLDSLAIRTRSPQDRNRWPTSGAGCPESRTTFDWSGGGILLPWH